MNKNLKKFIIVSVLFVLMGNSSVFASKNINFTKSQVKFISFQGVNPKVITAIEKGIIKIETNNDKAKIICTKKINGCIFKINDKNQKLKQIGKKINISVRGKKRTSIGYNVTYNTPNKVEIKEVKHVFPENFDISEKMKTKRIQERSLSCESSATADIMTHMGKEVNEYDVSSKLGGDFNEKPYYTKNGIKIWGDPNQGFVGYIDTYKKDGKKTKSHQYNYTGYGVYEKPISKVYTQYGFRNRIITEKDYNESYSEQKHLTELLKNLSMGNMVQLWGDRCTLKAYRNGSSKNRCYNASSARKLSWNYYDESGKLVEKKGLSGEHAFYLLGYKGTVDNPTHIIAWDTNTGRHIYPVAEWKRKWNLMQNRSIIIYK